jgi:L,D-transpeptidase YcbB
VTKGNIVRGKLTIAIAAAWLGATPALAVIETIELPPSRQRGLDMIVIDEEALPPEPELARRPGDEPEVGFGSTAVDPSAPVHPLYFDLQRQLERYQQRWGALPQVRVGDGGTIAASTDPRVALLRHRLGLPRAGGLDKALQTRLSEYQQAHGLAADGKAGPATLASLNLGADHFERLIMLNMERARRLPGRVEGKYVLVDAGSARLWMYENGRAVGSMKVVVGGPDTETPMLAAMLRFSSVNPYWNVPPELVQKLIAKNVLEQGFTYLSDRRYQVLESWADDAAVIDPAKVDWGAVAKGEVHPRVRQLPGGGNSMGQIKFMMPNDYGIYLHDTPNKALFDSDERWVSNGCVRVEDARRLARWLHGEMPVGSQPDAEEQVDLASPVAVYITYFTVAPDAKSPRFLADRYGRDAAVLARFRGRTDPMVDPDEQFRRAMTLES